MYLEDIFNQTVSTNAAKSQLITEEEVTSQGSAAGQHKHFYLESHLLNSYCAKSPVCSSLGEIPKVGAQLREEGG